VVGGAIVGTRRRPDQRNRLAIEMGADAVDIGKTIHPHPTLSESIGRRRGFEGSTRSAADRRKS
jgi:dihydrolipoamide dehydrogenase